MPKASRQQDMSFTPKVWGIVIAAVLMILSALILLASACDQQVLMNDVSIIKDSGVTFSNIVHLRLPQVSNRIGVFGVLVGYVFVFSLGKWVTIALFSCVFIVCINYIFLRENRNFVNLRIIGLFILFSFINLIILRYPEYYSSNASSLPAFIFRILRRVFKDTGVLVISLFGAFFSLLIVTGIDFFKLVVITIGRGFIVVVKGFFSLFKRNVSREKKPRMKPEKPVKIKEEKKQKVDDEPRLPAPAFRDEEELQIFDHAYIPEEEPEELPSGDVKPVKRKVKKVTEEIEPEFDHYIVPDIDKFLENPERTTRRDREETEEEIRNTSQILKDKLAEFGIEAQVINVNIGPIITQYELKPAPGVKVSRFLSLTDDLALAIKAKSIRIQAPIPGRGLIGIEIPNVKRDTIYLKDVLLSDEMKKGNYILPLGLGKDISGNPVITDMTKMPHLLIAGATGAGKSVCVNTMINSILLHLTPDQVRMVMIDPKRIELSGYEGIPHLIQNVVTDPDDALIALNWGVSEMERRYELLQKYKVRDIGGYNDKIKNMQASGDELEDRELPYILIIVDEFADLIMTAGRDIEQPIARLAQMARAIGIHLILATQRPSTKVITGIIKANFPARIAFKVSSKVDSRVIIDMNGAERLLGRGDMLFLPPGKAICERIHGAFMSDGEIENLVDYLKRMPKPDYQIEMIEEHSADIGSFDYDDELFPDAARAVISAGTASVSMLQRHFKIGYARAGRLIDLLEQAGVIGPHVGSKSREVLATEDEIENIM